jgi:hypothetical protein
MSPRILVDPPILNHVVGREMRELHTRLEVMEAMQRRTPAAEDISDAESKEIEVEEAIGEYVVEELLLKVVLKFAARSKIDVPMYESNLDFEEVLDGISSMDKYFNYEDVDEGKKVRQFVTRFKGHIVLWWDELQEERRRKGKHMINN